ncbi:MAG: hypothetical protein ACI87N_003632 [Flavobacteriales bacterium]|jgi:hypothetical protein
MKLATFDCTNKNTKYYEIKNYFTFRICTSNDNE